MRDARLSSAWRSLRLRAAGGRLGRDVVISRGAVLAADSVHIGDRVHIGRGVVLRARRIILGADCHLGDSVRIEADEIVLGTNCILFQDVRMMAAGTVRLGDYSKISRGASLMANGIEIGVEFWMNKFAEIGGGGWSSGAGFFKAGDRCHVGRATHINVAEGVTLGNDTAVGMDCTIATHAHWQPATLGYPTLRSPVVLGADVAVYSRCIVSPGVTIGDGATVAAGSVVTRSVPAKVLVAGAPAVIVREPFPSPAPGSLVTDLFRKFVAATDPTATVETIAGGLTATLSREGTRLLCLTDSSSLEERWLRQSVVVASANVRLTDGIRERCGCLFELGARILYGRSSVVSERLRAFLFSYGLKFRYEGYQRALMRHSSLLELGIE